MTGDDWHNYFDKTSGADNIIGENELWTEDALLNAEECRKKEVYF